MSYDLKRYQSNFGIRTPYEEMINMQIEGNAVVPQDIPESSDRKMIWESTTRTI
jgi:hypothetical protein